MRSYATTGFQARALALACGEVERMLAWRLSDEPVKASDEGGRWADPALRARTRCTVWLACTSNIVSAGTRETIRYLVQHRMISALVTSAVRGARARAAAAAARLRVAPPHAAPAPTPSFRLRRARRRAPSRRTA